MGTSRTAFGWVVLVAASLAASAADWPTYRHDIERTGATADPLKTPLVQSWVYRPAQAPQPAWGTPNPRQTSGWFGLVERPRVHFDTAFHPVVAGGVLYFGSSADGEVYALDVATGQVRWSFATLGPVRLAPTVVGDRLYIGSDDGFVYCLKASDGSEVWRFRAAPSDHKVLGSGRMISLWPVRTGVLVDGGVAHFAAGVFPAEGVYVYAVNAEDGKLLWCNDQGGAAPQSRISPQGYLLASGERLFVPMGRVPPAAYDRKDGKLLYETGFGHRIGGTAAALAGGQVYTGTEEMIAFDQGTRAQNAWFDAHQLVVAGDTVYTVSGQQLAAFDRAAYPRDSLRRQGLLDKRLQTARPLSVARRTEHERETTVRQDEQQLEALDKQIAALGEQDAAKLAELQAQRKGVAAKLARDTKALDAARKATEAQQKAMDKLNADMKKIDDAIAKATRWTLPTPCDAALAVAGGTVVAGGSGQVLAADVATGKQAWEAKVDGAALGLAAADGRLFVSTDTGAIYCFGPDGTPQAGEIKQAAKPDPFPRDELTPVFEAAADHIVAATGIKRGYCLVLGIGTGRLVYELAKRTELQFVGVCLDDGRLDAARKALDAAGLYGSRVILQKADPSRVPFAELFANLVVSEGPLHRNMMPFDVNEAVRMTKPLGGTICFGQPAARGSATPLAADTLRKWAGALEGAKVTEDKGGTWLTWSRGALPGAGSWTHQYAEPGNTTCSDEVRAKCPLGVLWFGYPGPGKMAERHRRPASPLGINGRLFVVGEGEADRVGAGPNAVMAFDAYNGLALWERKIPGALRTVASHDGGCMAVNDDSLFIAARDKCLRLDQATGETTFTYSLPPVEGGGQRAWGYVAVVGDLLYGTSTARGRSGDGLFALDIKTGTLRWKVEAPNIPQSAIAIGDGKVFFATSNVSDAQRQQALDEMAERLKTLKGDELEAARKRLANPVVQLIQCLDAQTGKPLWAKPLEITEASGGAYWGSLGSIYNKGALVLFGVFSDGHYWKQFFAGQFEQRRIIVLSAKDGHELWGRHIGYRVRPVVVGDTLHAEPWAFDLQTGAQKMRANPITGKEEIWQFARPGHHCGCPAASPNLMLFRSYTLGWYDLVGDYGTQHFGSQRTSCWINFIPANGLLMVPEGGSGCLCPFPLSTTVVFTNRDEGRQWAYYSQPGELTPVKRLAVNFGAPGDRRDPQGALWLGYPRPGGSLVFQFGVSLSYHPGWTAFRHDPARLAIEGTDKPWVFHSGIVGLRKCEIPVMGAEDGRARFTVRLAFADLDQGQPGVRVFDIKIQGKTVAEGFDIAAAAGGQNKAVVKEFKGIECDGKLSIELVPKAAKPEAHQLPILQGVDIEREAVLSIGFAAPSFLLNDLEPEQAGEIRIANHKDGGLVGTLRIESPDGFTVAPAETPLKLATGERMVVPVKAVVAKKGERGTFAATIRLVRQDGGVECERKATIEYLGALGRAVIPAAEDAWVGQNVAGQNRGDTPNLFVDGGDAKMGDESHHLTYLKFPLELPGKAIKAVLRLYNAGNPTGDSGRVCLAAEPWSEKAVTYDNRPKPGAELVRIGPVTEKQVVELKLDPAVLDGKQELSLVLDPTSCDGVDYISREGGQPAELVVEYQR